MRKNRERTFKVAIGMYSVTCLARTPGNAFRKAVRTLVKTGRIKRQPPTDHDTGGWKGASIGVVS